jgi:hypothetical protein
MSTSIKISQLPAKGANLEATDLLEVSEFNGTGYVSKSITGQEIIDASAGGGGVTDITTNAPLFTTGGTTPDLSISEADASTDGFITAIDWNTFNDKQDALISGTNIKTINGSSVLGSGDLVVSGGGGLQGVHALYPNTQGSSSFGFTALLVSANMPNQLVTSNRLDVYPFLPNQTLTNCSLTIGVVTLGVGVLSRIVIYSNVNSFPTTKLYESANIDCSTTGDKVVLANFTFTAGVTYWLGFYSNGAATYRGLSSTAMLPLISSNLGSQPAVAWSRTSTTLGTAPTTFNYTSNSQNNQVNIFIKPT